MSLPDFAKSSGGVDVADIANGDEHKFIPGRRESKPTVACALDRAAHSSDFRIGLLEQNLVGGCSEDDIDPFSGLTVGELDDSGKHLGAFHDEVGILLPLIGAECTRNGGFVAKGLDPDIGAVTRFVEGCAIRTC